MAFGLRRSAVSLAALLALAGCDTDSCAVTPLARIPFSKIETDARVAVPVEIDRKQARLLLDTGSENTVLTDIAFNRLTGQERSWPNKIISGIGGTQMVASAELWRLGLGPLGRQLNVFIVDHKLLPPIPPAEGLLGLNALSGYDIDLDIPGNALGLYLANGNCAAAHTPLAGKSYSLPMLPDIKAGAAPRFAVTIDGQTLVAEIDTGAPSTILFARGAARLGLSAVGDTVLSPRLQMGVTGIGTGTTAARTGVIDLIKVGRLNLRQMPVTIVNENLMDPVDLLLGVDFVRTVHVWLSASSHSIVLQYPPLPTP